MLINLFVVLFSLESAYGMNTETSSGVVRGQTIRVLNRDIDQYLSIPYAEPPIGSLRFAKPKRIEKRSAIIDATVIRDRCLQPVLENDILGDVSLSENCLFLNIWAPVMNSFGLKPVMFWIHGGSLDRGSGFQYNGSALAAHDVIVVTINYRLGLFGFFYAGDNSSAPGNVGLYDQLLALKWVRENIRLFGGDKDQITVFGHSAGSWSVSSLVLSPLATGLFKRVIMQSGAHLFNMNRDLFTKEDEFRKSKAIANALNCGRSREWLWCLRRVESSKLFNAKNYSIDTFPLSGTEFLPLSSHKSLFDMKFNKGLELMAGVAMNEGSGIANGVFHEMHQTINKREFFELIKSLNNSFHNFNVKKVTEFYLKKVNTNSSDALKGAFYEVYGDLLITCPTYLFAKYYAKQSNESNVYFYEITYQRTGSHQQLGVTHGADIDFVFGLPLIKPKSTDTQKDIDFSYEVMKMWTNFAKNGNPNHKWPELINTDHKNPIAKIQDLNPNKKNHIFKNPFKKSCDGFWKNYF